MAEYIEREAAKNAIRNDLPLSTWMKRSIDKALQAMGVTVATINAIPAADVVEVVRCRNCEHYDNGWCHRVHNPTQYSKTTDDWYCADGERMEQDDG